MEESRLFPLPEDVYRFEHEAMATHFAFLIQGGDRDYAGKAARECFREIDRLEFELSRFVEGGSIARVNRARAGERVRVHPDAWVCLGMAEEFNQLSEGSFDCCFAAGGGGSRTAFSQRPFYLTSDDLWVAVATDEPSIDLGGIGKGYALDRVVETLELWELPRAFLSAGGSTALALDPPEGLSGWPARLLGDNGAARNLALTRASLSGTGVSVKGEHIADPRDRESGATRRSIASNERPCRTWAVARFAAVSDALSTALFVAGRNEIEGLCIRAEGAGFIETMDSILQFGVLPPGARMVADS